MFGRTLTYAQKQKLTNSLFYTVAAGAIITVALPSLLPCPVKSTKNVAGMVYAEDGPQQKGAKKDRRQIKIMPGAKAPVN
jgi:hypothetical protein